MRRFVLPLFVLAVAIEATTAFAAPTATGPVVKYKTAKFGNVLATKGHLALYTWNKEKAGTIKCTRACLKAWPPLTIPKGTMAPKHIAGVMGTFGEITRPDGGMQVTFNGHALYTYSGDTPTKILCNGVDGWFVVKVH